MATYSVIPIVCDYGLIENDELILIFNSRRNAFLVKEICEKDVRMPKAYEFGRSDFNKFMKGYEKNGETD